MNPDSLCAKCAHLIKSTTLNIVFHYCKHRNSMQQTYEGVSIIKGFKTCTNFKPKKEAQK
jgi:hypothetical protein